MLSNAFVSPAPFAALANTLCNPLPQGQSIGNTTNVSLESGGIYRSYLISIPPAYNCSTPTPLIFSFHGGDRNPSQQQELSQMPNLEFNNFAIAPSGHKRKLTSPILSNRSRNKSSTGNMARSPGRRH
jgi:poly(3-hydroxybutyrate) depolymerase